MLTFKINIGLQTLNKRFATTENYDLPIATIHIQTRYM